MIELSPIMLPKATSAQNGTLIYDENKGKVQFIKSKSQASGRVDLFTWLVITVSRAFRKDKMIVDIKKSDIINVDCKLPTNFKYGEINIETNEKTYKFKYGNGELTEQEIDDFVSSVK